MSSISRSQLHSWVLLVTCQLQSTSVHSSRIDLYFGDFLVIELKTVLNHELHACKDTVSKVGHAWQETEYNICMKRKDLFIVPSTFFPYKYFNSSKKDCQQFEASLRNRVSYITVWATLRDCLKQ